MATIRKTKAGSYEVQIRITGLRGITKTFKRKADAVTFAREVEGDAKLAKALGKPIVAKLPFSEAVLLFEKGYAKRDQHVITHNRFWREHFKNKLITEIKPIDVDAVLICLSKQYTGSTVNRYRTSLSSLFNFILKHPDYKHAGIENPCKAPLVLRCRENAARTRFLSDDEQVRLLVECRAAEWPKLYLLVLMALTTGARKGELMGLTWTDIDLTSNEARLHTSKNGEPRVMPLIPQVVEELKRFRGVGAGLVFNSPTITRTPFEFKKQWSAALVRADIQGFRFHDLRHSCASFLAKNGANLFEIGQVLGHKSQQSTSRYAHLCNGRKAELVNNVFRGVGL